MNNLKMYILIKDDIDSGHAINSAAHAGLIGYLKWKDDPIIDLWLNDYFRKVTCKVTEKEYKKAKTYNDYEIITELAFDNKEVGLVFKPRWEYPKLFKFLKLFK